MPPQKQTQAQTLAQSLAGAAWLTNKHTQAIMDALGTDKVRVVGGCVRDALLGKLVTDVDMATTCPPDETMEKLQQAGFEVIPRGIAHGTVMVVVDGRHYEITSLRADIETDGRHAKVRFGMDWTQDAARRDFTVNALYANADGQIYDPLDTGLADLQARRVVFIGKADERIAEDYLRVLRFFRFHYGLCEAQDKRAPDLETPDPEALQACAAAAQQGKGLRALSAERIQQEMLKILALPQAVAALQAMHETGVLAFAVPEIKGETGEGAGEETDNFARLTALIEIEAKAGGDKSALCDPFLRLGALLPNKQSAEATAQHLHLSKKQTSRLLAMHAPPLAISADMSPKHVRQAIYATSQEQFIDACLLAWANERANAQNNKSGNDEKWRGLIDIAKSWQKPVFPLTGEQMKAAQVPAGPLMGRIAKAVEQWWITHDFPDDKDLLQAQLEAQIKHYLTD